MYTNLMMETEMMNASEQISPVIDSQIEVHRVTSPALAVFAAVLKLFLTQLESVDARVTKKLRQSVLAQISLCLSSLKERQHLNAWMEGNTDQLEVEIGVVDMQHCIHHAYMGACNYFGPSRADELLSKAIKDTEDMPIAKEFAPSNLI